MCGVNDDKIQHRLLWVTDMKLDFKKALELVMSMQAEEKNAPELPDLKRMDMSVAHHRCGKPGHKSAQCSFRTTLCHNCGKVGHLARVCRENRV